MNAGYASVSHWTNTVFLNIDAYLMFRNKVWHIQHVLYQWPGFLMKTIPVYYNSLCMLMGLQLSET